MQSTVPLFINEILGSDFAAFTLYLSVFQLWHFSPVQCGYFPFSVESGWCSLPSMPAIPDANEYRRHHLSSDFLYLNKISYICNRYHNNYKNYGNK